MSISRTESIGAPCSFDVQFVGQATRTALGHWRGHMENPGFLDYRIPVASDLPMIDAVLVEVPNPGHPYGAKGVAEVNICPPMAAIANAIDRAIGRRMTELPMSPPKVLAAIDAGK